eukprot:TRINITY_DN74913_c0_g1_i1.p1 TRINITY_DN74913_c0_g1~~TRINITY_DN74913_c0_g1_i1.p1  ORF type:complete len:281 (-),score=32.45 TRINITY_DN74913_c0_g1_i1:13-855(-)
MRSALALCRLTLGVNLLLLSEAAADPGDRRLPVHPHSAALGTGFADPALDVPAAINETLAHSHKRIVRSEAYAAPALHPVDRPLTVAAPVLNFSQDEGGSSVRLRGNTTRTWLNRSVVVAEQRLQLRVVCQKDLRGQPEPLWKGQGCYNQPCDGVPMMPCWNNSCWIEATGKMNFCAESHHNCVNRCGGLWCNGDETKQSVTAPLASSALPAPPAMGTALFARAMLLLDTGAVAHGGSQLLSRSTLIHVMCMGLAVGIVATSILKCSAYRTWKQMPWGVP